MQTQQQKISLDTSGLSIEEWLRERQKGIGGSDVAAVLGLSKFKTALDVYNEKISDVPLQILQTPRMRAGIMLEQVIADWYAEESGKKVVLDNKIRKHREHNFLIANIDRVIYASNGEGTGVLECKTTNSFFAKTWDTEIPMEYYCQLQHYLLVTGYTWGEIAVLIDGYDFRRYYFTRDDEFITALTERLVYFWTEHVAKRIPPDPVTEKDVLTLFPKETAGKTIVATEELRKIYLELKNEKALVKAHEGRIEVLEESIKLLMQDAETIQDDSGSVLVSWKAAKDSMVFNSKLFKETKPDLYKEFMEHKPGSRRFLVK